MALEDYRKAWESTPLPPAPPEDSPYLVDTREQWPYDLAPSRRETLKTGDYAIVGAPGVIVERKSLADFIACCGKQRERFERELERMQEFHSAHVVIEASITMIAGGHYRSLVTPQSILASIRSWSVRHGITFWNCLTRREGRFLTEHLLRAGWWEAHPEFVTEAGSKSRRRANVAAFATQLQSGSVASG